MTRFAWTPALEIGVPLIDAQHQSLVARAADLLDCAEGDGGSGAAVHALAFLSDYVEVHFDAEERLMEAAGYPELPAHREDHRAFRGRVRDLRRQFLLMGPGAEFSERIRREVCDWIVKHVQGTDALIGQYLRAHGAGAEGSGGPGAH